MKTLTTFRTSDLQSSCMGKCCFNNKIHALEVAKSMRTNGITTKPYECKYCQFWHLGESMKAYLTLKISKNPILSDVLDNMAFGILTSAQSNKLYH